MKYLLLILTSLAIFTNVFANVFADLENKNTKRIQEISNQVNHNRMMTQMHRWYLFYENHQVNLDEQIDIFVDNVTIKTPTGERHGKNEYRKAVMQYPKTWRNSHHILKSEFDGFNLNLSIVYQNTGILSEGKLTTRNIYYNAEFIDNGDVLPKFKSITLSYKEGEKVKSGYSKFIDAYLENRLKSLVYYYLSLIEFQFSPEENFKQIFSNEINFKFSDREIKSHDEFLNWVEGVRKNIFIASHSVEKFKYKDLGGGLYEIQMEFQWNGFANENQNQELEARTKHKWIVSDNPEEKFPRIKSIDVKFIKPFTPKK